MTLFGRLQYLNNIVCETHLDNQSTSITHTTTTAQSTSITYTKTTAKQNTPIFAMDSRKEYDQIEQSEAYAILGLQVVASPEEVETAYYNLVYELDPDNCEPHLRVLNTELSLKVEGAYRAITNSRKDLTELYDQVEQEGAHEILGVGFDASPEQIKTAYRTLVLALHPDKCEPRLRELHTTLIIKVYTAYETVKRTGSPEPSDNDDGVKRLPKNSGALHMRNVDFKNALRAQREAALDWRRAPHREHCRVSKTLVKGWDCGASPEDLRIQQYRKVLSGKGCVSISEQTRRSQNAEAQLLRLEKTLIKEERNDWGLSKAAMAACAKYDLPYDGTMRALTQEFADVHIMAERHEHAVFEKLLAIDNGAVWNDVIKGSQTVPLLEHIQAGTAGRLALEDSWW
ncbi:DnaJ sub C member 1 [Vermiconidia calcicola]|uniref:DnaJ sub C member 1 n=1 Tax=Vermiconidia calcicola TaxID=1690605 RepID=A0ACC3N0U8_9PEZI|nr:DnaJ sub C member 1 [Vermiconidia calcicola]